MKELQHSREWAGAKRKKDCSREKEWNRKCEWKHFVLEGNGLFYKGNLCYQIMELLRCEIINYILNDG